MTTFHRSRWHSSCQGRGRPCPPSCSSGPGIVAKVRSAHVRRRDPEPGVIAAVRRGRHEDARPVAAVVGILPVAAQGRHGKDARVVMDAVPPVCIFCLLVPCVPGGKNMDHTVRRRAREGKLYCRGCAGEGVIRSVAVVLHLNPGRPRDGACRRVDTALPVIGVEIVLLGRLRVGGGHGSYVYPQARYLGVRRGARPADAVAAAGRGHTGHRRAVIVALLLRPLRGGCEGRIVGEVPAQVGPVVRGYVVVRAVDAIIDDANDDARSRVSQVPCSQEPGADAGIYHPRRGVELTGIEVDERGRPVDQVPLAGEIRPQGGVVGKIGVIGIEGVEVLPAPGGKR